MYKQLQNLYQIQKNQSNEAYKPTTWLGNICIFEISTHLPLMDYFSYFPLPNKLHRIPAEYITRHMQANFSDHGWPDHLISDNGPCFTASEIPSRIWKRWAFITPLATLNTINLIALQKNVSDVSKLWMQETINI